MVKTVATTSTTRVRSASLRHMHLVAAQRKKLNFLSKGGPVPSCLNWNKLAHTKKAEVCLHPLPQL